MTSREITSVALKCLAIYILFNAIVISPIILATSSHLGPLGWRIPVVLGISLIVAVAGYFTWRLANSLIGTFKDTPTDQLNIFVTPIQLEAILFRVLGVFFVVTSLQPFVRNLILLRLDQTKGYELDLVPFHLLAYFGVIILGMFLIAKPKAWVQLLKKIRAE